MGDEIDAETQENELVALESIYDDEQFSRTTSREGLASGQFQIKVDVPANFAVRFPRRIGQQGHQENEEIPSDNFETLELIHVPPIVLRFTLPVDYPSKSPPTFQLSCVWLDLIQLSKLCQELDSIWDTQGAGDVILFQWIQFLMDDTLSTLGIGQSITIDILNFSLSEVGKSHCSLLDKRVLKTKTSVDNLVMTLTDHNRLTEKENFDKSYFDCNVCFEQRQGAKCIRFPTCDHVFCNECMGGYFSVQIKDGAVRALNCPSDKCDSQATPRQVKDLVSADLYEKYEIFLLQSGLDCMSDVFYCPRLTCQSPVIAEQESTCAVCPICGFAFCVSCKQSFHGVAPCRMTQSELQELREKYLKASQEEQEALEKMYEEERLKRAMEDMISEQWLEGNAKKCPVCGAQIQKTEGCNKMTCTKCRCHFCWLCGCVLDKSNPYLHFNSPGAGCFNLLLEGVEVDEDFDDNNLEDEGMVPID